MNNNQNKSKLLSFLIKKTPVFLFIVFLLLQPIQSKSQENQSLKIQELYDLSIEELLNVEVITASRYEQSITDAPGIISVLTAEEIEKFGAMNLFEILNRMPNVISSLSYSLDVVTIRGGDFNAWSGRIAYLIDGFPVRNSGANGTYYNLLYSFPISSIKQIEVIRGPGSVLYGTNAFDGVINIITKDGSNKDVSINTSLGQYNTSLVDINVGDEKGDLKYNISGFFSQTDGAPLFSEGSATEPSESFNMFLPQKNVSFNSNISYKNFRFNFLTARSDRFINHVLNESFAAIYTKPDDTHTQLKYNTEMFVLSMEHEIEINDKIVIKNTIGVNDETFNWVADNTTVIHLTGKNYYAESLLKYDINKKLFLLSGINYRKLTSDESTTIPSYNFDYLAFFAELKYAALDNLTFYLGAQYNKPINYEGAFVPRLSGLYKLNANYSIKFSYAQAFRSPDPPQYLYDNRVTAPDGSTNYYDLGNPDLKPEIVSTHDLQFIYKKKKLELMLTGYHSKAEDLILSRPEDVDVGGETVTYLSFRDNFDYLTMYGLEFESKFSLLKSLYITSSFVYNQNEYAGKIKNHTLAPNYQFKVGVSYSQPTFSVASFLIASDAYKQIAGIRNTEDNIIDINPDPNKFYDLSVKVQLYVNKLFPTLKLPHTALSMYGRNLLDYKQWQPDHYSNTIKALPGMPGRNINFQLSVKF